VNETTEATAADAAPAAPASSPRATPSPRIIPETPTASAAVKPEARRISPDELRAMIDRGDAVLVDVRGASDWAFRRASEAVNIPSQDLFARSVELPHQKLIALYCT
jgi:predicted sulfurtransferase